MAWSVGSGRWTTTSLRVPSRKTGCPPLSSLSLPRGLGCLVSSGPVETFCVIVTLMSGFFIRFRIWDLGSPLTVDFIF